VLYKILFITTNTTTITTTTTTTTTITTTTTTTTTTIIKWKIVGDIYLVPLTFNVGYDGMKNDVVEKDLKRYDINK